MKNSVDRHLLAVLSFLSVLVAGQPARADEVDSRSDYIVNGSPTEAGELRGTVALLFVPEAETPDDLPRKTLWTHFRCSAVLIAPSVAVTAAHCADVCGYVPCGFGEDDASRCYVCEPEPLPAGSLYVAAGARTLDDVWATEITAVRELVVHEGYLSSDQWFYVLDSGACEPRNEDEFVCEKPGLATDLHDIALLLLEAPVTVLNPARLLPGSDDLVGGLGTAHGYGLRAPPEYEGLLDQQQYASLLNETTTPIERVTNQEVLTAEGTNRSGVCSGDSGGPLYVQQGNKIFVAGVASRTRLDMEEPICGAGAIYTSLPGHIDWIQENAPEAIDGAGGGCSAASTARAPNAVWLAAILASLVVVRTRRAVLVVVTVALLGAPSAGCGWDSESDQSFCSDKYDPTGDFCDPGVERIDLRAAEQRARSSMPRDAWLWSVVDGAEGGVNPDGEAEAWFFRYFIAEQIEPPDALFRAVTVFASGDLRPYQELGTMRCVPTQPMILFDSKDVVHDAIGRFEQAGVSVRVGEDGKLRVFQSHRCARGRDEWSGVGFASSFVYYDDEGDYLAMEEGP